MADCHVMTGKGYAFVTFQEVPSAQAFLEVRGRVQGLRSLKVVRLLALALQAVE